MDWRLPLTIYSHRQSATRMWVLLLCTALFVAALVSFLGRQVPEGEAFLVWWVLTPTFVILIVTAWLFSSLTVSVDSERVHLFFGPGWPNKSIGLAEIRGVRAVRNSWWYGWGIRYTPHGWMWNIAGFDAVELELDRGRRCRIGTDEPRQLAAAIRSVSGLGETGA
jgi:hypothetical protein